jgi:predicted nucleic acid-binding protein
MKVFRVVADSSCLIGLSQIGLFNLLKELFSEVYIPDAIYDEVVINGKDEAGSEDTEFSIKEGLILKKTVNDEVAVNALRPILGKGEAEVIILYKELELDCALIDEKTARSMAEIMNVNTMGVLGIIDLAAERGFTIDKKKVIDRLRDLGFRISDKLYKKVFPDTK